MILSFVWLSKLNRIKNSHLK